MSEEWIKIIGALISGSAFYKIGDLLIRRKKLSIDASFNEEKGLRDEMKDIIKGLKHDVKSKNEKIEEMFTMLLKLTEENAKLREQVSNLEQQEKAKDILIQELKGQVEVLSRQVEELNKRFSRK